LRFGVFAFVLCLAPRVGAAVFRSTGTSFRPHLLPLPESGARIRSRSYCGRCVTAVAPASPGLMKTDDLIGETEELPQDGLARGRTPELAVSG